MKKLFVMLLILALVPLYSLAEGVLGQPFPDFTATDTEGNTFSLSEALKTHDAVLVNIWASWCGPCEAEFPDLTEVYESYKDRVAFIALSCEPEDTMEVIEDFRQSNDITFPMGRDEGEELIQYTGSEYIPVTVIVDCLGFAAFYQNECFDNADQIKAALDGILGDEFSGAVDVG